jgi:predicted nucleotidyltransferase component of viral defense system
MMISKKILMQESKSNYYKPEILEKVYQLLTALNQLILNPYLRERLVLKGGTALNLFYFDKIPRLSVDIDLNYIGQVNRSLMLKEQPVLTEAIRKIFLQQQFELDRNPNRHAGGKMIWRYASVLGQKGNLEVDLNYMYREPLWPIVWLLPKLKLNNAIEIPVLDLHELAAGKLSALFSRRVSRDLFDAHYLLTKSQLDIPKLRLSFVIYLSMSNTPLDNLNHDYINYDLADIRNRLLPVLHQENLPLKPSEIKFWAELMVKELKDTLNQLIPLNNSESSFITYARAGNLRPEFITDDKRLISVIQTHPAILWQVEKASKQLKKL